VVETSTLDSLYAGLPVVVVGDWEDVTMPLLETAFEQLGDNVFSKEKLFASYWRERIRS